MGSAEGLAPVNLYLSHLQFVHIYCMYEATAAEIPLQIPQQYDLDICSVGGISAAVKLLDHWNFRRYRTYQLLRYSAEIPLH